MAISNWHLKCYEIVCSDNEYIIGLVQDCRNSIANTLKLLQVTLNHRYVIV